MSNAARRSGGVFEPGRNGLLFPEKMRQMGECARADYLARFISSWSYPTLFGERRRSARA